MEAILFHLFMYLFIYLFVYLFINLRQFRRGNKYITTPIYHPDGSKWWIEMSPRLMNIWQVVGGEVLHLYIVVYVYVLKWSNITSPCFYINVLSVMVECHIYKIWLSAFQMTECWIYTSYYMKKCHSFTVTMEAEGKIRVFLYQCTIFCNVSMTSHK